MKKVLLIFLLQIISLQFILAQPQIVDCPLDTNSNFEITLGFSQFKDSSGKINIQMDYGYAIPILEEPNSFKHEISNIDCTPFNLEISNNLIYIYDSTGNWRNWSVNSNKFLLNKNRIIHLKIYLGNTTSKTLDMNDILILKGLKLQPEKLEIYASIDISKSNIKLNLKHGSFKNIRSLYIHAPYIERKKRVLRQLGKYKNLYKIELHHPFIY